jgi:hypothetical protein
MYVDAAVVGEQIAHQHQPLVDHRDEGIGTLAPGIAVGNLFKDVRPLGEGVVADLDIHREIRADIERRIDIDQFEAALLFDLLAQGAVLERRQDELVVAPDELVGPALELAAARVGGEEVRLQGSLFGLFGARLVHLLDDLKGQDEIADLVALAVPDQFDLALVLEEQEAKFFWQRFIRLEIADDLLLFRFGQSRHQKFP